MAETISIVDVLFDHEASEEAKAAAETELTAFVREREVPFLDIGWDWYDGSLELHGVPPNYRLSEAILAQILALGFLKIYVNHSDKWETHYSRKSNRGWRVSYPHKRNDGDKSIWVEESVPSWPQKWFRGRKPYAVVKPSTP